MPALNPAAEDDVSCESFCALMAVADIDTPRGKTAGAAGRLISAHHAV